MLGSCLKNIMRSKPEPNLPKDCMLFKAILVHYKAWMKTGAVSRDDVAVVFPDPLLNCKESVI